MRLDTTVQKICGFLGTEINLQLRHYVLSQECEFQQSTVGKVERHDPAIRVSSLLRDLGAFTTVIEQRVLGLVPGLIKQLGLTPFAPSGVEIEIAAHGDGAFYRRHIDLFTDTNRNEDADRFGCILLRVSHTDPTN